jgi:methanogenic corrinoid protein MtbC1
MAQLYPHIFNTVKNGRRIVAVCVGDELHEMGLHMVADLFEMGGWDTYFLGSNTPVPVVLQTLATRRPEILAISATMTYHIELVTDLIAKVRQADPDYTPKIIVGGYPFNLDSAPDSLYP